MSKRETIKTKKEEIISYWRARQSECGLSINWNDADQRCWRCGCKSNLERCHIIPHALGGKDEPENLVLLCKRCHAEGPNVKDSEVMWDWIRAYGVTFYDSFWAIEGLKEYKFIYGCSFENTIIYIVEHSEVNINEREIVKFIENEVKNMKEKLNVHYGEMYLNRATIAGEYRMVIKAFAKKMGVDILAINKKQ